MQVLNDKMSQIRNEIKLHEEEHQTKISAADEIPPKLFLTHAYELLNDGYEESVVHDEIMTVIAGVC